MTLSLSPSVSYSLGCHKPTNPHTSHSLCAHLQQHPRVNLVASVLVQLEDVPRCVVVNLTVDKKILHLALHLEAPVAVGLLDDADAPAASSTASCAGRGAKGSGVMPMAMLAA